MPDPTIESVTRIKFCGITTLEDAELAVAAGAWAIGLIFWPSSPRRAGFDAAAEIAAGVKRRVEVTGVFVNATLDHVAETADAVGLTMLQLHGDEGPAYCAEAARRSGARVIKAAQVSDVGDVRDIERFHVDFHLLDARSPRARSLRGGTGESFDWELLRARHSSVPLILSGGLNEHNVAAAIATAHPYALDTASGTEAAPGRKDPRKLSAFFAAARAAAAPAPSERPGEAVSHPA